MKRYEQLRGNTTLTVDGKPLEFKDGVLVVDKPTKKVSEGIKALEDAGYLKEIVDETTNS